MIVKNKTNEDVDQFLLIRGVLWSRQGQDPDF